MKRIAPIWPALVAVASVSATATVLVAGGDTQAAVAAAPEPVVAATSKGSAAPSAAEFGRVFVGTTNRFAAAHGDPKRVGRPHCVQASRGHYMCSYAVTRPGAPSECRLMQARWTPDKASTITVTLGGRTARCGSLREALDSLE